jgi:hypothetical protein
LHPNRRSILKRGSLALFGAGALSQAETPAVAQRAAAKLEDCNCTHAPDGSPLDTGTREIRPVIERYRWNCATWNGSTRYPAPAVRQAKLEGFFAEQKSWRPILTVLMGLRPTKWGENPPKYCGAGWQPVGNLRQIGGRPLGPACCHSQRISNMLEGAFDRAA